ncbi:OsmC family protein [Luteibacter rhizovicinus]|nr:OsmC family protein [Luteibacter rhizovicinus]
MTAPLTPIPPSGAGAVVEPTGAGLFQSRVTAGNLHFIADEPVADGGNGTGPGPYDLLAAALGACTVMTLRLYASRKSWDLGRLRVEVVHTKDATRTPADVFTRTIVFDPSIDGQQRTRLLDIADRCPVHRTLEGGASVVTHVSDVLPVPVACEPGAHVTDMEQACAETG